MVMDQATGYVKAIVGGRGTKTGNRTLNRATAESAAQQPGSCFKILSTYGPGLDQGQITLATTVVDEPYYYESGQEVHNSTNRYIGTTNIRNAIKQSINTCAVRTLTEIVGPAEGYEYVKDNFAISTIVEDDMNQALALGGITKGVRNIDITAAFASIANKGTYTTPVMYTQILDHDGNVLIDNTVPATHQAVKDSTAYLPHQRYGGCSERRVPALPPDSTTWRQPERPDRRMITQTAGSADSPRTIRQVSGAVTMRTNQCPEWDPGT